jgi:tyrosyl-tRNA synthetase
MELKKKLARDLVTQLHGDEAAARADEHFTSVFQKRQMPADVPEVAVGAGEDLRDVLVRGGLAKSKSEANRLIRDGAVSVDGVRVESGNFDYKDGNIIKVGKHRFIRIKLSK